MNFIQTIHIGLPITKLTPVSGNILLAGTITGDVIIIELSEKDHHTDTLVELNSAIVGIFRAWVHGEEALVIAEEIGRIHISQMSNPADFKIVIDLESPIADIDIKD